MAGFTQLTSTCIPMRNNNVDTDQIIPARYLLMITKDGYGEHLFQDWRYDDQGQPKSDFILNNPIYQGAGILLAGENFGSGSSREHAVWALTQYGIKVVIAPSFSDIFRNNAYGNGLLVINVPQAVLEALFIAVETKPQFQLTVDLEKQKLMTNNKVIAGFEINPFVKDKLVKGLDNIGYILDKEEQIRAYEQKWNK